MVFNSYIFIFAYLPLFMAGLYILMKSTKDEDKRRSDLSFYLMATSLAFFAFAGLRSFIVFLISLLVNLLIGRLLAYHRSKVLFIFGVVLNILAVYFFRQSSFFALAVSFYSFSQIWFLKEIYSGRVSAFTISDYLLSMTYFPKLLQGPIVRFSDMRDRLESSGVFRGKPVSGESFLRAVFLFVMGLSKKVLLADIYAGGVSYVYDNVPGLSAYNAFLGAILYSLQIYFDFSAYCDMGLALAMMMGVELPINFNKPYKARNIDDFWKRWHISLTSFLTDNVYIPLGGNRKGRIRTYINFLIVFFVSGLWHGRGINFIIWGMLHGFLYVIVRAIREMRGTRPVMPRVPAVILTFLYVSLAWVFFRAADPGNAFDLIGAIIRNPSFALSRDFLEAFMIDELWFVIKVTPLAHMAVGSYICLYLFLIAGLFLAFCRRNAYDYARTMKINGAKGVIFGILFVWCVIRFGEVSTYIYSGF